jgi:hypothetical protein
MQYETKTKNLMLILNPLKQKLKKLMRKKLWYNWHCSTNILVLPSIKHQYISAGCKTANTQENKYEVQQTVRGTLPVRLDIAF